MSGYQASCPSCGATIVFALGSSLLRVCEHCGVAVARKGANLANYGKVADLIPTPSVLALGMDGDYEGAPPFRLVGRLQLDWGQGTLGRVDARLRGRVVGLALGGAGPLPLHGPRPAAARSRLRRPRGGPDAGPRAGGDLRRGRSPLARGSPPRRASCRSRSRPGSELHYADLSGPGGQFATLDYGTGDAAESLYVGREVTLADLGLRPREDEERRKVANGEGLKCPQCAGPLEVRAPDQTQRIACP